MKKVLLNPLAAPVFVIFYVGFFFIWNAGNTAEAIFHFCKTTLDTITYMGYALSFLVIAHYLPKFKGKQRDTLILMIILWFCALFREMGIQHWLTTTDTTAFKLRFFTNPGNPMTEKIFAATLLLGVALLVIYLLFKYTIPIIRGFFQLNPFYWTICTGGAVGVLCKIADRVPGNLRKAGNPLDPMIHAYIELFEEATEATLPLLFALAIVQYTLLQRPRLFKKR